jgi:hypothetical protein
MAITPKGVPGIGSSPGYPDKLPNLEPKPPGGVEDHDLESPSQMNGWLTNNFIGIPVVRVEPALLELTEKPVLPVRRFRING